jgi:hypothetical protein
MKLINKWFRVDICETVIFIMIFFNYLFVNIGIRYNWKILDEDYEEDIDFILNIYEFIILFFFLLLNKLYNDRFINLL